MRPLVTTFIRNTRLFSTRKAVLTITPKAIQRLQEIHDPSNPKTLKIGIKNKGCSGQTYSLEYVEKINKFDEIVQQDGVKVAIDSKALMSIIGSVMDFQQDPLSSQFVFNNPNIKEHCGCGLSFTTGN